MLRANRGHPGPDGGLERSQMEGGSGVGVGGHLREEKETAPNL